MSDFKTHQFPAPSLTCNCRRGGGWRAPKSPRRRRPAQRRRKRPRRAASVAGRPDPNDVDRPAGLLYDRSGNLYSAGRTTAVCPIPALSELGLPRVDDVTTAPVTSEVLLFMTPLLERCLRRVGSRSIRPSMLRMFGVILPAGAVLVRIPPSAARRRGPPVRAR